FRTRTKQPPNHLALEVVGEGMAQDSGGDRESEYPTWSRASNPALRQYGCEFLHAMLRGWWLTWRTI
ncbi:MAG: hypothetical protein ACKPKO_04655, partial [Candidatus Fonsibacter sp.]